MVNLKELMEELINRYGLERPPYKRGPALPKCSECGGAMLERTNKTTGQTFLGCSNFPSCRNTSFKNKKIYGNKKTRR